MQFTVLTMEILDFRQTAVNLLFEMTAAVGKFSSSKLTKAVFIYERRKMSNESGLDIAQSCLLNNVKKIFRLRHILIFWKYSVWFRRGVPSGYAGSRTAAEVFW